MMLLFAAVTLALGIFSLRAGSLGLAMLFAALIELRFARRLRAFEGRAATVLAINQLVVGAALIVYAVTGMVGAVQGPSPYDTYLSQGGQIADMMKPIAQLHSFLALVMYGLLIAGVLISQPCLAWYYLSRRGRIETYREQTPRWVAESLEAAGV
jgi:hypothetical protein